MNNNERKSKFITVEIYVNGQRYLVIAESEEELRIKINEIRDNA